MTGPQEDQVARPRTEAGKRAVTSMTSARSTDPYPRDEAVRLVRAIEDEAARLPDSRVDIAEPDDRDAALRFIQEIAPLLTASMTDPKQVTELHRLMYRAEVLNIERENQP